ncbi:YgfZ/GcvT domain-containing protein [Bacteroidota bacterium]
MQVDGQVTDKLFNFFKESFPKAVIDESGIIKSYTSVKDEYDSLIHGVAVRNISNYGMLKFSGKDSLDFLHRVTTNSVKNLESFQKVGTLFINEKGRFIDRTILARFDDDLLMISESNNVNKLKMWIKRYIVSEDITIDVVNDRWVLFEVIGPQSDSYMTLVCGDQLATLNDENIITVDVESIKFYLFKKKEPNGIEKYWILSYSVIADKLIEFLLDQKSVFDFNLIGENAYDIFRIENGIPSSPNEINDLYNPHESNLLSEICFSKGCYIGQEVIARLDTYDKVQRILTGIIFDAKINPSEPLMVLDNDKNEIGTITSIAKYDFLDKMIGLGYIRKSYIGNGTEYLATDQKNDFKISLTSLPFSK